jgi:hypothetical protein
MEAKNKGMFDASRDLARELKDVKEESDKNARALAAAEAKLLLAVHEEDERVNQLIKDLNIKWEEEVESSYVPFVILIFVVMAAVGYSLLLKSWAPFIVFGLIFFAFFTICKIINLLLSHLCSVAVRRFLVSLSFWDNTIVHSYEFVKLVDQHGGDLRPHGLSQSDLKYKESRYARVDYVRREGSTEVLRTKLTISAELFAHLTLPGNLNLSSTEEVAWDRLQYTAKTMSAVNLDRYLSLKGRFVVQDTTLVAFGLYKQLLEKRRELPFPTPPST